MIQDPNPLLFEIPTSHLSWVIQKKEKKNFHAQDTSVRQK
jgi:hypothetical protein